MMNEDKNTWLYETFLVLACLGLVVFLSYGSQRRISLNEGRGWDGSVYYAMAGAFVNHEMPDDAAPYVYRIGTPFLVSLVNSNDLLKGYQIVNITAGIISVFLLMIYLRFFITSWSIRTILTCFYISQWHAPIRFSFFYPSYADPINFVFLLLGLIYIEKIKVDFSLMNLLILCLISFFGVIFREFVLIIPLCYLFAFNSFQRGELLNSITEKFKKVLHLNLYIPILAGLFAIVLTHVFIAPGGEYSFIETALHWFYRKSLAEYVHSFFNAFGPVIVLGIFFWRNVLNFLYENQHLAVFFLITAGLAWIGGSDTERLLYFSMPVVYIVLGKVVEENIDLLKKSWPALVILFLGQLVSQRIFWATPDYPTEFLSRVPVLTFWGSDFPFLDLYSHHGETMAQAISLVQHLFFSCVIILVIYKTKKIDLK